MLDLSLYIILDEKYTVGHNLKSIISDLAQGGAKVIQLREKKATTTNFLKDAFEARAVTKEYRLTFIVNDRIDIALASEADGVHLGQDDMAVKEARKILVQDGIIGVSVNSQEQAITAANNGASYIAVGCLFPSKTKTKQIVPVSLISDLKKVVNLPVLGIGGITWERIPTVLAAGANGICVASGILNYPNIKEQTKRFCQKIQGDLPDDKAECNRR